MVFLLLYLLMERSESLHLNGSGSGTGRSKNIQILRIWIRNTVWPYYRISYAKIYPSSRAGFPKLSKVKYIYAYSTIHPVFFFIMLVFFSSFGRIAKKTTAVGQETLRAIDWFGGGGGHCLEGSSSNIPYKIMKGMPIAAYLGYAIVVYFLSS
jgi:hypothetical protein